MQIFHFVDGLPMHNLICCFLHWQNSLFLITKNWLLGWPLIWMYEFCQNSGRIQLFWHYYLCSLCLELKTQILNCGRDYTALLCESGIFLAFWCVFVLPIFGTLQKAHCIIQHLYKNMQPYQMHKNMSSKNILYLKNKKFGCFDFWPSLL